MAAGLAVSLVLSLAITLAAELSVALIAGRRGGDLALVCLVNIVTNPATVLLYFLATRYASFHPAAVKAVLEAAVVLSEAAYYRKYGAGFKRPLLFSICANAFSFGIGELIVLIGG